LLGEVLLGEVLLGEVLAGFEATVFEPVAFAAVFAVLCGIRLLLFFEDFVAATLRASFTEVLPWPLVALRATAAAFFEVLEALFLRVFCDTACARKLPRPCSMFYGNLGAKTVGMANFSFYVPNIAHFAQKTMIYARFGPLEGVFRS
jgi:hypothetical protein